MGELFRVVGLERVLVQRVTASPADAQILRGLEEYRSDRQTVQFRTQAINDLGSPNLAFRQRFERNIDETGIGRAAAPGEQAMTFATAGSLLITLPICWME